MICHALRTWCPGLLFGLFVLLFAEAQAVADETKTKRPNIIFILADDLGWGDLGCYGNRIIRTPNLDRMASQGTLFTQFYVNASVCSPSRCAFFTGQYPARHRIHGHYATAKQNEARGMSNWLEPNVPNVASLLRSAGYKTAHIGKWHLGNNSGGPPVSEYGFDFVGTSEKDGANGPAADPYFRANSTKHFVDEAIQFIESSGESPFYLQLWTLVPHATLNPTPEQMAPYARLRAGGKNFPHASAMEIFAASVTDLDTQIGRLLQALKRLEQDENTLILFSSDNGPEDIHVGNAGHSGVGSAGPFRGRKRSLYEGGIRVPGIVRWPGRIAAGRVDQTSILAGVDWLPTVAGIAGLSLPADHQLDGEDASDVLLKAARPRRGPLMWEWRFNIAGEPFHHSPQLAIRDENWKLLMNPDRTRTELYDMTTDLTQMNNLAQRHPDVVERLAEQVTNWAKTLPEGPRDPNAGRVHFGMPSADRRPSGE
jgi:arylsulfatase A-like enzyme